MPRHTRPLFSAAEKLAAPAGAGSVRRVEVIHGEITATLANEAASRQALETAGVEFIDENGGGPGVRLRKSNEAKPKKK